MKMKRQCEKTLLFHLVYLPRSVNWIELVADCPKPELLILFLWFCDGMITGVVVDGAIVVGGLDAKMAREKRVFCYGSA